VLSTAPTGDSPMGWPTTRTAWRSGRPTSRAAPRRCSTPPPGWCAHDHGLAVDPVSRLAFIACDANATLLTLDLSTEQIIGTNTVGDQPDVLAYDQPAHRLYVASASGWVSVLYLRHHQLSVAGSDHLADDFHVVAVDPGTHHSYYPVPAGANGHPALLEFAPAG